MLSYNEETAIYMAGEIFSASSLQPKFQNDYQNNEVWSQTNDLSSNVYVIIFFSSLVIMENLL